MEIVVYIAIGAYFALNFMIIGAIIGISDYEWTHNSRLGKLAEVIVILAIGAFLVAIGYLSELKCLGFIFGPIIFYWNFYCTSTWRNIDVKHHKFIMDRFETHPHWWPRHQARLIHKRFLKELF